MSLSTVVEPLLGHGQALLPFQLTLYARGDHLWFRYTDNETSGIELSQIVVGSADPSKANEPGHIMLRHFGWLI